VKKYPIYILIFVLLALIFSLRSFYHYKEVDRENFIAKTQSKLNQELQKVEDTKVEWKKYFQKTNSLDFQSLNAIKSSYPFFIFKNTSLVYWSDEHYAPESKKYRNEGWHFVRKSSGQYLEYSIKSKDGSINLISVIPLFEYYDVNNEYIQSRYNSDILPPSNINLQQLSTESTYALNDLEGKPIFFISLAENFENYSEILHYAIILLEFILAGILILLWWNFSKRRKYFAIRVISFILGISTLWGLMEVFDFPFHSKDLKLFDPKFFASSDFNPSLGYLIINCVLFFLIGHFSIRQISKYIHELAHGKNTKFLIVNTLSYLSTIGILYFIHLVYIHSNWGLDSTSSIEFSIFQILSFGIVLLLGYLAFQVFSLAHAFNTSQNLKGIRFLVIQFFSLGLFLSFALYFGYSIVWIGITVLILNTIIHVAKLGNALDSINFLSFIYLFLVITAISVINSIAVQSLEKQNESMQRNIYADRIINGNDVLAEYMLGQLDESLKKDEYIKRQFLMPLTPYKTIVDKIEKYYLNDYFDKYEKSIKIYDADGNTIYPSGTLPMSSSYPILQMNERNRRGEINLYLVGNAEGNQLQRKYIYVFEIKHYDFIFAKIVLEFKPKKIRPDNVFPELLVKNRNIPLFSEIPYAYALYKNDTLSYSVGDINFPDVVQKEISKDKHLLQIQSEGNLQFNVVVDKEEKLVFSKKSNFWYRFFSNTSFFFILCFIFVFTISAVQFLKLYWKTRTIGLGAKIQLYFSLAFLVPLLSVSISTIGFVNATFLEDIVSQYEENTNRVASQLVPLLMNYENGITDKANLNNEISTITKIINADINLYDLNGQLSLTSQPQVFEKNLLSYKINPKAYASIYQNGQKMITLEETVGNLNYQSAYVGIRSFNSGELLAILGSPFFKSNKEYDLLLTDLLNNVFNIFVGYFN
jgi:hypothetical protein